MADNRPPRLVNSEELNLVYLWAALFFAVVIFIALKQTLPAFVSAADWLAFYGAMAALATLFVVGYQVLLARRQDAVLIRQDEILARRELLKMTFRAGSIRFEYVCTDQERAANHAYLSLPFEVRNSGSKAPEAYYLRVFLPNNTQRGLRLNHVENWYGGSLEAIGVDRSEYQSYNLVGKIKLIPDVPFGFDMPITVVPSNEDITVLWQIISDNGWAPGSTAATHGLLYFNVRRHH